MGDNSNICEVMGKTIQLGSELDELIRELADDGTLGGVYLAKPTGELLEEDHTYMEVLIGNKSFFAKPCFSFGSWNFPGEKWLKENKDKIMAWVAFENGNPAHAVYLGIQPLDNKMTDLPYKNGKNYSSTKYRYWIDDDGDEFKVERFSGKTVKQFVKINPTEIEIKSGDMGVVITDQSVVIGDGKGTQSVVMGEKLVNALTDLLTSIMTDTLLVSGTSATHSPAVTAKAGNVANMLTQTLSKKVKIE